MRVVIKLDGKKDKTLTDAFIKFLFELYVNFPDLIEKIEFNEND